MKGDFSRDSFDPLARFTRVLKQQGRVEIDADDNEREAIQLRLLRQLAADLIGPHGGPKGAFALGEAQGGAAFDFAIAPGSYYVDGVRIENPDTSHYAGGKDRSPQPGPSREPPTEGAYFAWVDVRERHVSALEHDGPLRRNDPRRIADVALNGQDSASRAELAWTIRLAGLSRDDAALFAAGAGDWTLLRDKALPPQRGLLAARAVDPAAADSDDPCLVGPTSAYRGVENQLYRVEIWQGGTAEEGASFVWSRENGAVLFAVTEIAGKRVRLAEGWHDARFGLGVGDVVSIEGPDQRMGAPAPLLRVEQYDDEAIELELDAAPGLDAEAGDVVLRRWDHRQRPASAGAGRFTGNAIALVEREWITLEDGIAVRFAASEVTATYRPGDFWLIPARTAIGDVLWPADGDEPAAIAPHGLERHIAPLGLVRFDAQGKFTLDLDLRKEFTPLTG